jgi:hypothetical protein
VAGVAVRPTGLGGMYGRLVGLGVGAALTVLLLRLYRVEAGRPWPGRGDRPYPWPLAGLYVVAAVVLTLILWGW